MGDVQCALGLGNFDFNFGRFEAIGIGEKGIDTLGKGDIGTFQFQLAGFNQGRRIDSKLLELVRLGAPILGALQVLQGLGIEVSQEALCRIVQAGALLNTFQAAFEMGHGKFRGHGCGSGNRRRIFLGNGRKCDRETK